jgi:hypothetical protein
MITNVSMESIAITLVYNPKINAENHSETSKTIYKITGHHNKRVFNAIPHRREHLS